MSISCLFTLTILASLSAGDELKCTSTTIKAHSKAVVQCYYPSVSLNNVKWSSSTRAAGDGSLSVTTVGNLTTLTITGVTTVEEFDCTATPESNDAFQVTGTARVNGVVYLAGSSVGLYTPGSTVSCVISDLTEAPSNAYWTSEGKSFSDGVQDINGAKLTPRIEDFAYTSQEMYLTINGITTTSQYTCSYEFSDGSKLSTVVYAVLRPTTECEHTVTRCKTYTVCTGSDITKDTTCLNQCNQCYDYTPLTYHNCSGREKMCRDYLNDFTLCHPVDARGQAIEKSPLAKYCDMCGWCIDKRFKPAKLILPLITLIALCLLTLLTCYKSIEEKKGLLPKVQVTSASPEAGKIKSFPFKNGDTVIPNRVVEEKGFLGPSAAVEIHNSNNEGDQIILDEGEDGGDAQSVHEYLASTQDSGIASSQDNNGGCNSPIDEAQFVVEGVIEGLLTSLPVKHDPKIPSTMITSGNTTAAEVSPSKQPFPTLSQIKRDDVIDSDQISVKLENEKTENEKIEVPKEETEAPYVPYEVPKVGEVPNVPNVPEVVDPSNGVPQTVVGDEVLLTAVKGGPGGDELGEKSV